MRVFFSISGLGAIMPNLFRHLHHIDADLRQHDGVYVVGMTLYYELIGQPQV